MSFNAVKSPAAVSYIFLTCCRRINGSEDLLTFQFTPALNTNLAGLNFNDFSSVEDYKLIRKKQTGRIK